MNPSNGPGTQASGIAPCLEPLETRLLLDAGDVATAILADGDAPWYWPPEASVFPVNPDMGDPVWITLEGEWPDSSVPGELTGHPSIERIGSDLFVSAYSYRGISLPVVTPWSMTGTIGPLPAGDYAVFASLYYWTTPDDIWLAEGPDHVADFSVAPARPQPPSNVRIAPRDDTGASDSDGITKDPTPEIIWEPSPDQDVVGYEVSVSFHNERFWVLGTSWVWPYRSFLPEGTHTIYVRAKDHAGHFSDPAIDQFTIDYSGPRIVLHSPAGIVPEPANEVHVTFNEPINEGSFTIDDVMVTADALLLYIPVTDIRPCGFDTYRIAFDGPGLPVDYHVLVGPHVEDLAGNEMDQDADGINGEMSDDTYDASFVVVDVPQVVGMWPAPGSAHWLVSSVRARFSKEMDGDTIHGKSFWVSRDPGGDGQFGTGDDVRVEGFVSYDLAGSTAVFTPYLERLPRGLYALCIEDDVTDAWGAVLDGEWPGVWPGFPSGDGEAGGDYVAEFVVDDLAPTITNVTLNSKPGLGVSDIEPSGIGVRTIDVTFSEAVDFVAEDVTVQTVTFLGGVETVTGTLAPTVEQPAPDAMRITLGDPVGAVDTWVRVILSGTGTITDAAGNALDGEPAADSSGLGYIYDADLDLPSGNGVAGGDAVFYVGSLQSDFRGFGPDQEEPNGTVDSWDINGFTQKYLAGDLDADFRGFGPDAEDPNGTVDSWDINGFTSRYTQAIANGTHLDDLPTAGGQGMAPGTPSPLPLLAAEPILKAFPEVAVLAAENSDRTANVADTLADDGASGTSFVAGRVLSACQPTLMPAVSQLATMREEPVAEKHCDTAATPWRGTDVPSASSNDLSVEVELPDLLAVPALGVLSVP